MHRQVSERFGRPPSRWLADGGFISERGIERLAAHGTTLYAPLTPQFAANASADVCALRARMGTSDAQRIYRDRVATIEWVNAGMRNRGLYAVTVRGAAKARAVVLWQALAHNVRQMLTSPALQAA